MKLNQQKLPKRKDLCKLLGLNEQDVDLMIVPEVKVAQKVALKWPQNIKIDMVGKMDNKLIAKRSKYHIVIN